MPVSVANVEAVPGTATAGISSRRQPYQCQSCGSRFTRHENLKRHAAVHSRSGPETSLPCEYCQTTFSRRDLRFRHMKRKHPEKVRQRAANEQDDSSGQRRHSVSVVASEDPSSMQYQSQISLPDMEGFQNALTSTMDMDYPTSQPGMAYVYQRPQIDESYSNYPGISQVSDSMLSTSVPTCTEEVPYKSNLGSLQQGPSRFHDPFRQHIIDHEASVPLEPPSYDPAHRPEETFGSNPQPTSPEASSNSASPSSYLPDGLSPKDVAYIRDDWFPSPSQSARGYSLYFNHVSQFVPFLHRPTFDATETAPHLGLSMLCLAYQHGEDPDCGDEEGSGARLSQRCFHRARVVTATEEECVVDVSQTVLLVQSYWLLEVYVMMYLCGADSAYGHKIHSRMISLTRFGGLTQPPPVESTTTEDLDDLWRDFIKAESQKRTLLAVHQIDALWYQLFSIPRLLSHLEIKHDLPCREDCWTAISSAQWAHRQLAARQLNPLVPYSDAVRVFLSPEPDIASLPQFDLYGAVNIAQFLLSSAREVSGWSTMTGRLSMERFEPLQSSLIAMEQLIRPNGTISKSTHAASCEATWEMAMLELLLWSPLHTSGIIGGSVDTFLTQSTYLATSSHQTAHETSTKVAVQPHLDWFLHYLDTTSTFDSEPPWLILYAYKAFLIAWQLLREGLPGAMTVLGVADGDIHGAVVWARRTFKRKHRCQLNNLIESCLDMLDE